MGAMTEAETCSSGCLVRGSYCLGIEAARFWKRCIAARELNKNYKSLIVLPPPPKK